MTKRTGIFFLVVMLMFTVANIFLFAMTMTTSQNHSVVQKQFELPMTVEASTEVEMEAPNEDTDLASPEISEQVSVENITELDTEVPELDKKLEVATIGFGGGHVSSFTKQLIASPQAFKKYRFEGDVTDLAAVTRWAEMQAVDIAKRNGKIDWKFGGEIRVSEVDRLAPLLVEDAEGNLSVQEYLKDVDGNFPSAPERITEVAETLSQAVFQAHQDAPDLSFVADALYEYFQTPVV